jgi:hypothetical protein
MNMVMREAVMHSETMVKTIKEKWLLLWGCAMGVGILLVCAFTRGLLSFRGFGIAVVILGIAYAAAMVLIIRRSAKGLEVPEVPVVGTIDDGTRKLFLRRIRRAKINIALLSVVLVLAIIQIREFPWPALLLGGVLNLLTTAHEVRTVIRLRKILS